MRTLFVLLPILACLNISCVGGGDLNNEDGATSGDGGSGETVVQKTDTPVVTGTTPASPANSATFTVNGTSESSANIEIFSDGTCSTSVATGTSDSVGDFSISVSQDGGTSDSYYVRATASGETISDCSSTSATFVSTFIRPGLAWLSGTQTTAPTSATQINQGTAYALEWSSSEFDANYYSHSTSTDAEKVVIQAAGDYLVSATIPMEMTAGTYRPTVRMEVRVNGTLYTGAIGESSYIRYDSGTGHTESSDHVAILLESLTVGDEIEIYVSETAGEGGNEIVSINSTASLYLEYVSSSRNVFTATATRTVAEASNINTSRSAFEWQESRTDATFTHVDGTGTGSESVTLNQAGNYMVFVNVPITTTVQRASPIINVRLNGATVTGGTAIQGYVRADSGHNEATIHWSGMVTGVNIGDTLTVTTENGATGGSVTTQTNGPATLFVEYLNGSSNLISLDTTEAAGFTWNNGTENSIIWTNSTVQDSSVYTYPTGGDQSQITVLESGDYLLVYNDALTSTVQRSNPKIKVQVNTVDVPGAETKTHYNRNQSGHIETSASLVFLLRNLTSGDVITLSTVQEAIAGSVTSYDDAVVTLIKK